MKYNSTGRFSRAALMLLLSWGIIATALAQEITVSGTVVSSDNDEPLPGVSVVVKGTTSGTVTDVEGRYTLSVPDGSRVLVFSYVGYLSQEIAVGDRTRITVTLEPDVKALEEVVVVGYGVQKKASVTASIATVTTKELLQTPQANISNMLVGRLPGLFAIQRSGQPGYDESMLRIRGVGTFTGEANPLIMVDGIERTSFNEIDPNEIESLSILKDASATAIYGVRGANGVVLITTKQGRKDSRPEVSYSGNIAIQQPTKLPSYLESYDYAVLYNEALKNDSYVSNSTYTPRYSDEDIEYYKNGTDPIFHPSIDWMEEFFKPYSLQSQHNLSISGGADRTRYFISAGYFEQEGMYKHADLNPAFNTNPKLTRYNFRSNVDFDITDRFSANIKLAGNAQDRNYPGNSASMIFLHLARTNPLGTPGLYNGQVVQLQDQESMLNPFRTMIQQGFYQEFRSTINSSVTLNYKLDFLLRGLRMHGTVAYDSYYSHGILRRKEPLWSLIAKDPNDPTKPIFIPQGVDRPLGFEESFGKNRKIYSEFAFNYENKFGGGAHTVTGLVLYNQSKYHDPELAFLVPRGYQGVVSRFTYNFKDRYMAEVNMGYNGTENFAEGHRFGFFPAYSLSWVPSEEAFFPDNNIVTFVKLRGSYGVVGNDKIGGTRFLYRPSAYGYSNNYSYFFGTVGQNFNAQNGSFEDKIGNPDLIWEKAEKTNVGLEVSFLKNSNITLVADYFYEYRDNILADRGTIPTIVGANLPAYNLGRMENKGFEIELTAKGNIGEWFLWTRSNYTFARNKVLFKDEAPRTYSYQNETGQRVNQFFGLIADGFYNSWDEIDDPNRPVSAWDNNRLQPGDIKYVDYNKDGKIDLDDQVPIGYSGLPEKVFGASFGFNFRGFDFSVLFQGAGNVSFQYYQYDMWPFVNGVSSAKSIINNRWTQERYEQGEPIEFPRLGVNPSLANHNYQNSTFWIRDASYVRLKNMEIGYTFSQGVVKRLGLKSVRIYANGNNLHTWTDLIDFDPESASDQKNTEVTDYPQQKVYNLGLNVKF